MRPVTRGGHEKNTTSRPRERRIDGWELDRILVSNLKKPLGRCEESWGYSPEWQGLYPLFLSHTYIPVSEPKRDRFRSSFGLCTCLVPKFEIVVLPCCCTAIILTFQAILLPPIDPACSKTYISALLLKSASFGLDHFLVLTGLWVFILVGRLKMLQTCAQARSLQDFCKESMNECEECEDKLISIDFWEAYDPDEIYKTGFPLIGSESTNVRAVCFLCGSVGLEKVLFFSLSFSLVGG